MQIFDIVEELEKERKKNKIQADYICDLICEKVELQKRIDKVIELIESIEYFEKDTKGIMRFPTMKIKNILKGDNK